MQRIVLCWLFGGLALLLTLPAAAQNIPLPDRIDLQAPDLYPTGLLYSVDRERFFVGSSTDGMIYSVFDDASLLPFAQTDSLGRVGGLALNRRQEWLIAATNFNGANLTLLNLYTGDVVEMVDLSGLVTGETLAHDVTGDLNGNMYITDSRAGVIYRVTEDLQASVYLNLGVPLYGITHHAGGFLIAATATNLINIPLDAPGAFSVIDVPVDLSGADDIIAAFDTVYVARGARDEIYALTSNDLFTSATVLEVVTTEPVYPAALAQRDDALYLLHSYLDRPDDAVSTFAIQRLTITSSLEVAAADKGDGGKSETAAAGISDDAVIAVGWGGTYCGVTAYQIEPDGVLDGIWSLIGQTTVAVEVATPVDVEDNFAGTYRVEGVDLRGDPYTGDLTVTVDNAVLRFDWVTDDNALQGVGVWYDDVIAVGWGGDNCGVVAYQRDPETGLFEGAWTAWAENEIMPEQITPVETDGLTGSYTVLGLSDTGGTYAGTLDIEQRGAVYYFLWNAGGPYAGVALVR